MCVAVSVQRPLRSDSDMASDEQVGVPERQSRSRTRTEGPPPTQQAPPPPPLLADSKAERIARYKAERRRQLAERYGISLEPEAEPDYTTRYSARRRQSDGSERSAASCDRHAPAMAREEERGVGGGGGVGVGGGGYSQRSSRSSSLVAYPPGEMAVTHTHPYAAHTHTEVLLSERERRMNLENQRRAQERGGPVGGGVGVVSQDTSSYMDVSGSSHRSSSSPGDLFIEQQAQSILQRHG